MGESVMTEEFDPFAPGSNLKENFDGTIREVTFEKSENSDNYNAHIIVQADDGEEVESFLGLGKDWVSYDGGRTVEHPRGNRTKFNAQTTYSEYISFAMGGFDGDMNNPDARAADLSRGLGADKVMRERNRRLENRGPQCADLWEGLRFHFDVLKRMGRSNKKVTDSEGRTTTEWFDVIQERMMPVRFLGTGAGTGTTLSASAPPTVSPPATSASPAVGTAPAQGVHPALASLGEQDREAIVALARTSDFGGFVDGVMGLNTSTGESMLSVPSVIQALSDEAFYQTLRA